MKRDRLMVQNGLGEPATAKDEDEGRRDAFSRSKPRLKCNNQDGGRWTAEEQNTAARLCNFNPLKDGGSY